MRPIVAGSSQLFCIHGLLVDSEFPLDGRAVERPGRRPDYVIRDGGPATPAAEPQAGRVLAEFRDPNFGVSVTESRERPGRITLRYQDTATFVIDRDARTIVVHPASASARPLVPVFLGGGVLAYTLGAAGCVTLHASAVELGGRTLAVAGSGGAGKSTVAALLCGAGAHLVTDDVLRVDVANGRARCFLGTSVLRLRPGAAPLADVINRAEVSPTADGRLGVSVPGPAEALLPLDAVLVPSLSPEAAWLAVERLGTRDGFVELLSVPRLIAWRVSGPMQAHFAGAARLARSVQVYRGTIPWGLPFPTGLGERILEEVGMRTR